MELHYTFPSDKVNSLVVQYEHVSTSEYDTIFSDKHISSGYASLVFNTYGAATILDASSSILPPYFMVVPLLKCVRIGVSVPFQSTIVTCKAPVLSRLLNFNLNSEPLNHYRIIKNSRIESLNNTLKTATNTGQQVAIIEDFIVNKLSIGTYKYDEIDHIYDSILNSKGSIPICDITNTYEKSPRSFRRRFVERVGVNAKVLARIARVNYLWNLIIKNKAIDFQDMVFEGGFYDQAHLIHDFKTIIGETPSVFFKRNLENTMLMSGKI